MRPPAMSHRYIQRVINGRIRPDIVGGLLWSSEGWELTGGVAPDPVTGVRCWYWAGPDGSVSLPQLSIEPVTLADTRQTSHVAGPQRSPGAETAMMRSNLHLHLSGRVGFAPAYRSERTLGGSVKWTSRHGISGS